MTDPWFEVAFGAHYPLLYAHRNEEEAARCLDLLPLLAPLSSSGRAILDLGCGDGRHLQKLQQQGLPAVGLDLSQSLLDVAAQRPGNLPLLRGDMRSLPVADSSLDSILSLFTAFGYFGPLIDNDSVIQGISRALAPGGHWFLDYFDCEKVRLELGDGKPVLREREMGGFVARETRKLSGNQDLVKKEVCLKPLPGTPSPQWPDQGLVYTEQVAVFDLAELDILASRYGLERVAGAGSYTGTPLGQGDRWILVYQRGAS